MMRESGPGFGGLRVYSGGPMDLGEQPSGGGARTPMDLAQLPLVSYRPRSRLQNRQTHVPAAYFASIDAHGHLGRWLTRGRWAIEDVTDLLSVMDACNIAAIVNLDGRWGDELTANLERYDCAYPGRFFTFCHVDWSVLQNSATCEKALVHGLEQSVRAGASGLKVWKDLGLSVRDTGNKFVLPDDARLDALWDAAGRLGIPVAIHTADPLAFFDPVNNHNERLEQLLAHPEWSYYSPIYPKFEQLITSLENVVAAHPLTTFIGLHVGCYAENLEWVSRMLERYDNFYIDIAARIAELGRQPRATRELVLRHPHRVIFGTDRIPPDKETYKIYFRFLESDDESFDYSRFDPPPAGRWAISGINLPVHVLRRVYYGNISQILGLEAHQS
jgi:predicted TIM-barrel fold metal-dependent hydrolase